MFTFSNPLTSSELATLNTSWSKPFCGRIRGVPSWLQTGLKRTLGTLDERSNKI